MNKLQELRREKKLTVSKLANLTRIKAQKLADAEGGKNYLSGKEILRLSKVLAATPEELFGFKEKEVKKAMKNLEKAKPYLKASVLVSGLVVLFYLLVYLVKPIINLGIKNLKNFKLTFKLDHITSFEFLNVDANLMIITITAFFFLAFSVFVFTKGVANYKSALLKPVMRAEKKKVICDSVFFWLFFILGLTLACLSFLRIF